MAEAHLRWERERARVTRARAFCARDGAAAPCPVRLLMVTPHATEVELVYTTPAQRRRGLAYATVARAATEADDACTFLFTDADGPAQRLYARLGFHPAGLVHRFLRAQLKTRRPRVQLVYSPSSVSPTQPPRRAPGGIANRP